MVNLEERFLSTPAFAVEHCKSVMEDMMEEVKQNLMDVVKLNSKFDTDLFIEITAREKLIDEYEHSVNDYLLKLNKTNLSMKDSTEVSIMLNAVSDLERIGDHAFAVANTLNESAANGEEFSRWGKAELTVLNAAVIDATNRAFRAFTENDVTLAKSVRPLEDAVDGIREELKRRHIRRLQKGECTVKLGLHFIDIVDSMERISDYGAVLAGYVLHDNDGNFNSHRYMKSISDEDRALYRRAYDEFCNLYLLPDMSE